MVKILVVDDEAGICDMLKRRFSVMGFSVFSALDGPEALEIFDREKPKVVFLDVRMDKMTGLEVLEEIKRRDPSVRVIMVTMLDDKGTMDKAVSLGADDFITKPFRSDLVDDVLRREITDLFKEKE